MNKSLVCMLGFVVAGFVSIARTEPSVLVLDLDSNPGGAGVGIDDRIQERDPSREALTGQRFHTNQDLLARFEQRKIALVRVELYPESR